ncbi:MAG TPA: aminotransferase class V-fold PLP-dependent enzyme [Clostridiaceae bacterium]|nr:aminotransferase class V-fold PLP-dependent enzyme [Clostridiaceae bacterium]
MEYPNGLAFSDNVLKEVQDKFLYVNKDKFLGERIYFDNAGGSFRLKSVEDCFVSLDSIPDCPERTHRMALYLNEIIKKGEEDVRIILNAPESGSIIYSLTASQVMFQMTGTIAENIPGTNIVTSVLEHPSAFDAAAYYAKKTGRELRIANVNKSTGGIDPDTIAGHIDKNTVLLSIMYASNITGVIFDIKKIVEMARSVNPDIYIIIDCVQHMPHGLIDLSELHVDGINFAPYKFFGCRGSGIGYVSERAARLTHHKLFGKDENVWTLGTPAPAQYAAVTAIVDYVCWLGGKYINSTDRRKLFEEGMTRIKLQERWLMYHMLEGLDDVKGLRHLKNVRVFFDNEDITKRDFILSIGFDNIDYTQAVREYEKRSIIVCDRLISSIYSERMLKALNIKGTIRVSPLHCNSLEDIYKFLVATKEIASI